MAFECLLSRVTKLGRQCYRIKYCKNNDLILSAWIHTYILLHLVDFKFQFFYLQLFVLDLQLQVPFVEHLHIL